MVHFISPGGRFTARATTVTFLIEWAYDILPMQHSAGPSWMDSQRYDFVAKAAGTPSDAEVKGMVRALLAERFNLKLRHETKEESVLIVTLGKSAPKLFPPKDEEKMSLQVIPQMDTDRKISSYHVVGTRFSFAELNRTFARQLERVIVDQTGLHGDFDFTIDLTIDDSRPNPLDPSLLLQAMQQQLGLTVKSGRAPVDYFAIESAEKATAEN